MAKKKAAAETVAAASTAAASDVVRMQAPKGTRQVGVPVEDTDEVVIVKVPAGGIVEVESGLASALRQHGFTEVVDEDEG